MSDDLQRREFDRRALLGAADAEAGAESRVRAIEELLVRCRACGPLADVGAFTGFASGRYARAAKGGAVCFDFAEEALAACRERGLEARRWNAAAEACPAADGEFGTVVAAEIIEHMEDTDRFLAELRRILAPGGLLIVSTPNLAWWLNRLRLAFGRVPWSYPAVSPTARESIAVDLNHLRISVASEWLALFRGRGFRCRARASYRFPLLPRPPGLWPLLREGIDSLLSHRLSLAFGLVFALSRE